MTRQLLLAIISQTVLGGFIYLAVLMLSPLVQKMNNRFRRGALCISAAMFLLPVSGVLAGLGALVSAKLSPANTEPRALPAIESTLRHAGEAVGTALDTLAPATQAAAGQANPLHPADIILAIYLLGVAGMAAVHLWKYAKFCILMQRHSVPVSNVIIQNKIASLCDEIGLRRAPLVYISARVSCPIVYGVFRPRVVMPESEKDAQKLALTLRHELRHIKAGDTGWNWAFNAAAILHWFNPIVYLLRRDFVFTREAACDEWMAARMSFAQRKEYAGVLLAYAARQAPHLVLSFASPHKELKLRLNRLLRPARPTRLLRVATCVLLAGAMLAVMLGGCGLAAGMGSFGVSREPADSSLSLPSSESGEESEISFAWPVPEAVGVTRGIIPGLSLWT